MKWLRSIKAKSMAYTLLITLVPVILLGGLGTLYFQGVIRQNTQNDYQEEACTIAMLAQNYLDRAVLHLERQSERGALVNALDQRDIAALDGQAERINDATGLYYWVFICDRSGKVLSSDPYGNAKGMDMDGRELVCVPLETGQTYIRKYGHDAVTGRPTTLVGTPIKKDGTVIGVLVGALDPGHLIEMLQSARALVPLQHIYMLNQTGHVIYSHNETMFGQDYSGVPAFKDAVSGGEGFGEYTSPVDGRGWVAAYAPVPKYNISAVVALPADVMGRPVNTATTLLLVGLITLSGVGAALALTASGHLARPLADMSKAAKGFGEGIDLSKYLPYDREDELGDLARAFRDMSDRITKAREKISGEKKIADLYIDAMGHDINNLNQVILSDLEMVESYGFMNEDQQRFLRGAKDATLKSAEIVRNVKAIQAATAGKHELRPMDLDAILTESIREVQDGQVVINYTPHKGRMVSAIPSIRLAFYNGIASAAAYACPEAGVRVRVCGTTEAGKRCYVTAIDYGNHEIPEQVRDAVTQPPVAAAFPPGRGLGLYTAKILAERCGGTLKIRERAPGDPRKGAIIIIKLPAAFDSAGDGAVGEG
jgi:signal transduction histidine kinase